MIHNYSTMADDVSHLSDPTGMESTPPRSSLKRISFTSSTMRANRIRNPWQYLRRVVQRNPSSSIRQQPIPVEQRNDGHNDDENDPTGNELEPNSTSMLQLPVYVESIRCTNLLLPSSTEIQQESDPLLIFEVSSKSFSPRSPTDTCDHEQEQSVVLNPRNQVVAVPSKKPLHLTINSRHHHVITVLVLYILLAAACFLGMSNVATSLQMAVLGIGTATVGVYSHYLQCLDGCKRSRESMSSMQP